MDASDSALGAQEPAAELEEESGCGSHVLRWHIVSLGRNFSSPYSHGMTLTSIDPIV